MLKNIRQIGRPKDGKDDAISIADKEPPSITDPSEKIRAKAVVDHSDADTVLKLATSDSSELVRQTAYRRYAQLVTDTEAVRTTLLNLHTSTEHRTLFFSITALSNEESLRQLSLEKASTDDDLLIIADKAKFHDTRMDAAKKIQSLSMVDKCWRSMKTKDKLVARELKARLDQQRESEQAAATQSSEVEKILTEMDKIANGIWQPGSANRFDHFSDLWNQLSFEPSAEKKTQYQGLHAIADEKAKDWRSKQSVQEQRQSITDRLAELNDALNKVSEEELSKILTSTKNSFQRQQSLWQELDQQAIDRQDIEESQIQRYNHLCKDLQSNIKQAGIVAGAQKQITSDNPNPGNLKKTLKSLESLKEESGSAAYLGGVAEQLEKTKTKLAQKTASDTELKQQIHKQFASLNSAISAKRWGPAKSIHERLAKKIARVDSKDKSSYSEKLTRLETKLNELGDWKEFASEPKLIALCEQMEKLPSLKLTPNDCANRIKELQTQWKAMGASPAQEKHWPRFKEVSDIAYEPCGKFFAARREEKKNKLAKRREICELLENYEKNTDWSEPDWRVVEKTLRTAKQEWKSNQVFDKKRGKGLEDRFTKILKLLDAKLDPVYEANASEKKELIAKVTKLGEGDINQHSINQVKSLQSAWRLSGACRQKDDRALWNEFRTATNKIFDTHRGKQREEHAASFEHVRRAREIIKTLSSIKNAKEPLTEKAITDLQTEYSELAEFPERDQKRLARDYRKATDAVDNFRQQSANNNRKRALQAMQHNADLCGQLEELAGQPSVEISAQIDTILDEWQPADKGENPQAAKAMEARKNSIVELLKADKSPDFEANTNARRLLCIELEILCDKETPQEDKAMRMQYQLDQLQKGLQSASASGSHAEQIEQLQIKWMTAAPASADWREKLHSRFNQTIESVKS